jgi:hypothetical protein
MPILLPNDDIDNSKSDELVRFYNDGPDWPTTPERRLAAEQAYRDAFLAGAREAATWPFPDVEAIENARQARQKTREAAEVLAGEQIIYRAGHEVEAASARGRHQALEIAAQGWERAADRGLSDEQIADEVIGPWVANVARWAAKEIDPARITIPPRPDDGWPEEPEPAPVQTRQKTPRTGNLAFLWNGTQPVIAPVQTTLVQTTAPPPAEPPEFPMQTLRELVMRHPHLRPPVVHGLLREGETMNVIASPKVGKSWLVADLALAVATGRPWLDTFPTERGNVLIVDNELHKRDVSAHRIAKVVEARDITLADCGDRITVANLRGKLKDIFGLGQCFTRIEPGQFKMVVIDAFYRALPRDTDENDNGTMAQLYNSLDVYAAKLQCAFVLIHHSTKGSQAGKAVTDVGAGAGAQSRAADTHLVLRPHEEPGVVVLDAAVRSWPPIEPRCLRWSFPVWTVNDTLDPADLKPEKPRRKPKPAPPPEPAKPTKPEWTVASFVAAFVTETPAMTARIVHRATEADVPEPLAKKLLKQAEAAGLIHRWKFGANQPVQFATRPQPEDE